jgi:hypothetical protein
MRLDWMHIHGQHDSIGETVACMNTNMAHECSRMMSALLVVFGLTSQILAFHRLFTFLLYLRFWASCILKVLAFLRGILFFPAQANTLPFYYTF